MPCGRGFAIVRTWGEGARHISSFLEYLPFDGVGSISIQIRYGGSGQVFHELRTAGKVSAETRKLVFLT
jgi:hypothetical protein